MDLDMDKIREQMEWQKRKDKEKYRAERFAIKDLAHNWEEDETGGELEVWLNNMAADGFVYRDALPTGDGFAIVMEKKG